ncbi:MAG: CusA/CzcA family heavy metal efflux RND transporter [Akkermansiaceae bacterium]|jgi:copper/silver efflux system protein|nr:CusA/CzcA family heavy metal efflux RND transporter [Akkermansiaceae bacterium]MDP4645780.1 CusA/CzcA family heavy metal efflux RND transporter [Akkermansiaceae bacterium]MDP4720083.1 CusA/CzcA family heavy metal efflux RND transporter [Akkermansiaceae bacterium]MDP4781537.1 CusA/CzcA family heavy metal efflux RND transporter [Akkermansiaceae bacterium]MDP4847949.1 CusA/CzcA family heavy metal efflux RND transporter [Akkermansiaceae bacterium]
MIEKIIEWSLKNRFLVLCATLLIVALGIRAVYQTPVDAIPDLTENQVLVLADWPGRSPQEVEDQVTYPLTSGLQGVTGVKEVRATSMFGFSLSTIIFEEGVDNYFARTRVLERLNFLQNQMPEGVTPQLGPDATGLGWVYQYYLHVDPEKSPDGGYDLAKLRSVQDWNIRYQLAAVKGVAEVASIGGFVKQYQIELSSTKMRHSGVTTMEVMTAVQNANLNVGGKVIEENGAEFVLRGIGLVTSTEDLELVTVKEMNGTPVFLKDIAEVRIGGDFRRGALDIDGNETVGGTVVMRTGENAKAVIERVKEKIAKIQSSLPPGITIKPFYDRSELIDSTIGTLKHALVEEMILVTLAHIIFLWHFRSILIVTLPLPISILVSFLMMKHFGITSNIMSLTGIAIAIGVLVDAAIVVTENVLRHCEAAEDKKGDKLNPKETWDVCLVACKQVGRPIFFSMSIIVLAFVPVFALTGQEGKLFHPLAFTKTFAMIGSTIFAVTLVPVLCSLLVRGPFHSEDRNYVMKFLLKIYDPALNWALNFRKTIITLAFLILGFSLLLAFGLPRATVNKIADAGFPTAANLFTGFGKEFMPPLNEGGLLHMPVLMPKTGLTEIQRVMSWQDKVMAEIPEIEVVAGKLGRFETATDPAPTEMLETTIMLKPEYIPNGRFRVKRNPAWREGMTMEKLRAELTEKMKEVPGYVPAFLQPIENRILMLYTGIRAQVGVKIYGDDLDKIQRKAFEIEKLINSIPGADGVSPSRVQGKPYLNIEVDRKAMARYGLSAKDVLDAVEISIGGKNVSTTIEGRERFPIQIRLQQSERDDIEKLSRILVATKPGMAESSAPSAGGGMGGMGGGAASSPATGGDSSAKPSYIPLGMVAKITRDIGANEIASENGMLRSFVQANVRDRDLGGFVQEVEEKLATIDMEGMTYKLTGEFENQKRFVDTMKLVFPLVLLVIFVLLFIVYHSALEAAHVMLAVPFALSGGVILQKILGYNFNGAVWVGYIALFGTAVQTGVVMVVYLEEMVKERLLEKGKDFTRADLIQAVKDGARLRLRPKVMTVGTIIASLLPIMWSHRQGAEVMQPLATPVIGGMVSSLLHILIVTPVIFLWLREREFKKGTLRQSLRLDEAEDSNRELTPISTNPIQ